MRMSNFFVPTLRETPAEAEMISHKLMLRAGMIHKSAAGIYSWLPLGFKVLQKVISIIREEMNKSGALELLMPAIQSADLWKETGRWESFGPQLLKIKDRHERDFCFGPTHEEVITDIMRGELKSYKQLPAIFYQIQSKFRDETRPRSGVMRAREFMMKDAYSFHLTEDSLQKTYEIMSQAYIEIFKRLGLNFRMVLADSGNIGGKVSHEFHVLADSGEDEIAISEDGKYAANVEVANNLPPEQREKLKIIRGIEVGHIFQLGDKYSSAMKATVLDEVGKARVLKMGCYGIGVSRIVAACIEQNHDQAGIIWPNSIAPFNAAILPMSMHKSYRVQEAAEKIYQDLTNSKIEVLFDDRKERAGVMFADLELIGIPHLIIISESGLDNGQIEYKNRRTGEKKYFAIDGLQDLRNLLGQQ